MSDTHQPSAQDCFPRVAPGEPSDCPFPVALLTQRFGFDGIPLTLDERARCLAARRRQLRGIVEGLQVECSGASTHLPEGGRLAYPVHARYHAALLVGGRRVHIETITQELAEPGGLNHEVRVYVDGALQGRSILLGRLGASVNTFPLAAALGRDGVMRVTPARWTDLRELIVEVCHRRGDHQ